MPRFEDLMIPESLSIDEDGSIRFSMRDGIYSLHGEEGGKIVIDEFVPISKHGVN